MSLVFKVEKLREAAKTAVKRYDDARASYDKNVEEYRLDYASKWNSDRRQAGTRALRDYLTECLKKGVAPRQQTAREMYGYTDIAFYSDPSPNSTSVPQPPGYFNPRIETTRAMVAFLDAYPDETITASQLKTVGFDDLASLYRAAVG